MRNALIAVLIITPLFGIMGTMIVNKKMAYFSDALGHSALTGIAVGVVCGMAQSYGNTDGAGKAVVATLTIQRRKSR